MKNIITGFALFMASVGFAAGNKMSMVTYFPVPYVAYSQVTADTQLDVGLTQNACNMSLGCTESEVNLKAHTVNLAGGRLDLNGGRGVVGDSISLGSVAAAGGQVKFKNVRINKGDMQSLNADDMRVSALHLFGKEFPKCKGKVKGDSDGKMSWQPLSLQGAGNGVSELYLVCGNTVPSTGTEPESDSCSDSDYYTAHLCECDPKPSNCCTQDWAEAQGMFFDTATRTCKCPEGTTLYQNPSSYWICHGPLTWQQSGNPVPAGQGQPYSFTDFGCETGKYPDGKSCSIPNESCYTVECSGGDEPDWGDSRGDCLKRVYICTD